MEASEELTDSDKKGDNDKCKPNKWSLSNYIKIKWLFNKNHFILINKFYRPPVYPIEQIKHKPS
jgi:hypothetical protein